MSLQAVVSYLAQKKGVINGKKAFQKYMYFIDAKGVPTPLNFKIHHYGPYSSTLDYETDNLELIGAIKVERQGAGFIISVGDNAEQIVKQHRDFLDKYIPVIDSVINSLPQEPMILELWSTIHFIASSMNQYYGGATKEKVVEAVKRIKRDKFKREDIEKAYNELTRLGYL